MKKFFTLVLALLLAGLVGTSAFAASSNQSPDYTNVIYQSAAGQDMTKPAMVVVKVRYPVATVNAPKVTSGESLAWDTNSSDGTAVIKCPLTNTASWAGIAVTDILTSDQGGAVDAEGRNWGYMAIHGFCFASMDAADYTAGDTITKSSQFVASMQAGVSRDQAYTAPTSRDVVGVLLQSTATKGSKYPVFLY